MAMAIIMTNAQRHSGADEQTRTRLLNRLGYFKRPTTTRTTVEHSSFCQPLSFVSPTTTFADNAGRFVPETGHDCSILRDATPVMVNLNDERDNKHYNDDDNDDDTLSIGSTSPTSCTVDVSTPGRNVIRCDRIESNATTTNNNNNNIINKKSTTHRRNYRRLKDPPRNVRDAAATAAAFRSPVVHFKEQATVLSIPSRYQYSNRIKKCLWSNSQELAEMAERNAEEFSAEGWDWHNVVLERDMYIDSATGDLIHPCHFQADPPTEDEHSDDEAACNEDRDPDCDGDGDEDCLFRPLQRQPHVTGTM